MKIAMNEQVYNDLLNRPILIVCTNDNIAHLLINKFDFRTVSDYQNPHQPKGLYRSFYIDRELILLLIDIENISLNSQLEQLGMHISMVTWKYHPYVIINVGTALGLESRGAKVGDVYLVQEFILGAMTYDVDAAFQKPYEVECISSLQLEFLMLPLRHLGFKEVLLASFSINSLWYKEREQLKQQEIEIGRELARKEQFDIIDFEAAAVAEYSHANEMGIPFIILKGIDKLLDNNFSSSDIDVKLYVKLKEEFQNILDYLVKTKAYADYIPIEYRWGNPD